MATAYDVLARAHEILQAGWCQEIQKSRRGGGWAYCAVGAIVRARSELALSRHADKVIPTVVRALAAQTGDGDIIGWNDAPGRTQAEVLAVFARAAEAARVEGEK